MSTAPTRVEPALYCGTYAKYNNGSIDGKWLKLRDYGDAEVFLKACQDLHSDETDPEFMFQDFEGMPRELYGESLALSDLQKIYEWLHLDDDDRAVLDEYLEATGYRLDEVDMEAVRDELVCVLDYTHGWTDQTAMGWYVLDNGLLGVDIPDSLESYIDVEALGRDWLMDLYVSSNGYVFEAGC
jgi:antirestriction protein